MLKIDKGEPWVMWPDILVGNFIDVPSNKIFDYNCDFEFKLSFVIPEEIKKKSTLFAKLPSYMGIDIESYGMLFIVTQVDVETKYITSEFTWELNREYELAITRVGKTIKVFLDGQEMIKTELMTSIPYDHNSHIVFGAGNFPQNGFNLNYFSVILKYLSIKKEGVLISEHLFDKFIHNKSFDNTNNCNFIYKI